MPLPTAFLPAIRSNHRRGYVVLPALGEDPAGYGQLQAEWTAQLVPRNLLEQHYVEKIAAASWRLRRLHRWQAQLFEDPTLSEAERLERLNAVLRHETALQRQIDTAVKLLARDVPQLYARRLRDQVLEDLHISERECRDEPETDLGVSLEVSNRLYQLRKATTQAANELSEAPLDTFPEKLITDTSAPTPPTHRAVGVLASRPAVHGGDAHGGDAHGGDAHKGNDSKICRNEPVSFTTRRLPLRFPAPVRRNRPRRTAGVRPLVPPLAPSDVLSPHLPVPGGS